MRSPRQFIQRVKSKRKTKVSIIEPIGEGSAARTFRVTVQRGKHKRDFALKKYFFYFTGEANQVKKSFHFARGQHAMAKRDLSKLQTLRALGFPTVPFPTATGKGLLMKELSEGGEKKVFDVSREGERFYQRHGERGQGNLEWDNQTFFRTQIKCKNYEHLANEFEALLQKAEDLGINLGVASQAFMVVVDKSTQLGKLIIVDVNEVSIPKNIMLKKK